jgi:DDE superfamily endonuclease
VLAPNGFPLWVSDTEPGSVHDITAARAHALPALYHAVACGLPPSPTPATAARASASISRSNSLPAGATSISIPAPPARNALQRSLPCLGERGFALLTGRWRTLQHITASPRKIGDIARAALVLTHFEHGYLT